MKITAVIIIALAAGIALAYLFIPAVEGQPPAGEGAEVQQYTCGMHPEIVSDEPGYCPICEMKLTPRKSGAGKAGSVTIDPTTRQNMGLVTTPVEYRTLKRKVRASGRIVVAEPNRHTVNLKVDGWVERLFVDHEGEAVHRGQPLLELYSPALVATQREYLIAVESGRVAEDLIEAVRTRLANWDISEDQLQRLQSSGEVTRTMTIRAPADGVVVSKKVSEGDHLKPGTELYEIADLSTVWVVASIYEQDVPFVSLNQKASVQLPHTGFDEIASTVSYVSPFLDPHGQVEIRLNADNYDSRLKPEMYAEVSIESHLEGKHLVIPRSAVINSGNRQLAYVASADDVYEPRVIVTGAVGDDDYVAVLSGLTENEPVVTSGQFLLDSESRLSEALADGYRAGHDHGGEHSPSQLPAEKKGLSGVYTCPMPSHAHVLQYGEGYCSECGMELVPVEETDNDSVYICPMRECAVVQNEPGRCPKCNMKLTLLTPPTDEEHHSEGIHDLTAAQVSTSSEADELVATGGHDIYTCPMPSHYHVLQYGEGPCAECGMKLVPLAETDNSQVYVCPMSECGMVKNKKGTCDVCGMNLVRYQPEADDDK
ncbi:MAG: efflux RND transporter periplasmic adaptor subunit [Candidatus Zixiibacteriota bacterium]|nr:MAG: efflux RND transporter periplasmic adaptor subunit [candidate division Zixibacteria bacterium]